MIEEVDNTILELLRKTLAELVRPEDITTGEFEPKRTTAISIINSDFSVEELGIGGSGSIKKEKIVDDFKSDGKTKDFSLSQKPLQSVIVENPIGTEKNETDDYTIDYENGTVSFRSASEKGGVRITYFAARDVAEIRNLQFVLTYSLMINAKDPQDRNKITMETIKALYREKPEMVKKGISQIRLIKGYLKKISDDPITVSVLEYQLETTVEIEMPMPAIEYIEIGKI
jgi:hypothetical protein